MMVREMRNTYGLIDMLNDVQFVPLMAEAIVDKIGAIVVVVALV
jgi:hypothetical protein